MIDVLLRALERVHGQLGWLAVVALLHPAILMRTARRRVRGLRLSVVLATATTTLAGAAGFVLYPPYRAQVKPVLLENEPAIGMLFERKEHLAFAMVVLSWVGMVLYFTASRLSASEDLQERATRAAHAAFVGAFVLGAIVGVMGIVVAAHRAF